MFAVIRVKDSNEKPTVRYERGLVMDSLTFFFTKFYDGNIIFLKKRARPKE
jgi:hypothetical protein